MRSLFVGTAIWVYCILVGSAEQSYLDYYESIMNFELDGAPETSSSFSHSPTGANGPEYLYNQTVFSKTGLINTDHTLVMTAAPGSNPSVILFDWAEYT